MFETHFVADGRRTAVQLPFDLDRVLADWSGLRPRMARAKPGEFTRSEWAYLIEFLNRDALEETFTRSFGRRERMASPPNRVVRPGGPVAVWLPNNVSLLGALTLILLSLTGNPIRMKAGSRGGDLTRAFLDYAMAHVPEGPLRHHLAASVFTEAFSRSEPRNSEWAASARCRLAFGSDEAVAAIHALPHPQDSIGFSFGHRVSEAWIELPACDDSTLTALLKVFDVYGQGACTSPARVVLLDASRSDASTLRDHLLSLWAEIFPRAPEMAVCSTAILDHQWSSALGWSSRLAEGHGAAIAVGSPGLERPAAQRLLPIVPMSLDEAIETLPDRIQTIGHALTPSRREDLSVRLPSCGVLRFVPVPDMHRFGPVWDGQAFWRETFVAAEAAR